MEDMNNIDSTNVPDDVKTGDLVPDKYVKVNISEFHKGIDNHVPDSNMSETGYTYVFNVTGTLIMSVVGDFDKQPYIDNGDLIHVSKTKLDEEKDITMDPSTKEIKVFDKKPSDLHELIDNKWKIPKKNKPLLLTRYKLKKNTELGNTISTIAKKILTVVGVPDEEKETWVDQKREATEWFEKDRNTNTITIDGILNNRNNILSMYDIAPTIREILIVKAYAKSRMYLRIIATLSGRRQGYEGVINAATTIKKIDEIYNNMNLDITEESNVIKKEESDHAKHYISEYMKTGIMPSYRKII